MKKWVVAIVIIAILMLGIYLEYKMNNDKYNIISEGKVNENSYFEDITETKNKDDSYLENLTEIKIYDIEDGYITVPFNKNIQRHKYVWSNIRELNDFKSYEDDEYVSTVRDRCF